VIPREEKDSAFVISFSVSEKKESKEFFEKFGFVIIRDVLSKEEVSKTLKEIWEILEFKADSSGTVTRKKSFENMKLYCELNEKKFVPLNKESPSTWNTENGWPFLGNFNMNSRIGVQGLLGSHPSFNPQAFANRFNKNVFESFSNILGSTELWTR
jgi:hypothetical protein